MKKTNYTTMVSSGYVNSKWQRVYTDGDRFYVKVKGEYIDITDTPCAEMMVED